MDREEFQRRRQARKERLENRAAKAQQNADYHHTAAHDAVKHIPFGQPILVGHHSERAHRNTLARSHRHMDKFCAELDKASHYERQAAGVGTGGISSDDPDALDKLQKKLDGLKANHDLMKKINASWRKAGRPDPSNIDGWQKTAKLAGVEFEVLGPVRETLARFPYYKAPFPSYSLQNNNANIKRVQERIALLEAASKRQDKELDYDGFTYRECTYENRVMFLFDGKPNDETRRVLKSRGFKWSPTRGAWVRMLNNAGLYEGKMVIEKIEGTKIY